MADQKSPTVLGGCLASIVCLAVIFLETMLLQLVLGLFGVHVSFLKSFTILVLADVVLRLIGLVK